MKTITADHDLCIDGDIYAEVICGNQPFLITPIGLKGSYRRYQPFPGQTILLNEWNGCIPTGRQCIAEVGQVSSHLQPEEQVVIGLLNVKVTVS